MIRYFLLTCVVASNATSLGQGAEGPLIASMDENRFRAPKEKAKAELVEGKFGKAVRFAFDKNSPSAFFTGNIRGTADWDKAAGFSFWVQGDGSNSFGGLQFIYDDDYAVRYDVAFPIKNTDWTKITVAWSDLIPILPGSKSKPLDPAGVNKPSKLSGLWVGKWWYWGEYPAYSFTLDEIRLEPTIALDAKDYKPEGLPLQSVHDKLKAGKPITIVTMGDSLTDLHHWANRKVAWSGLLRDRLQQTYKSEVTLVNPAIGGTQLRQNLVLMPRWLEKTAEPDLVTICFGGNDWESGMRGEEFFASNIAAVDRIRRLTQGKADVLLLTTVPGATNWKTMTELSEACRKAAKQRNAGLADVEAAFHREGAKEPERLYVDDRIHLSPAGHALVAAEVFKAIETAGK